MHHKQWLVAALAVAAASVSGSVLAQQSQGVRAALSGWYLGADVAATRTNLEGGDVSGAFPGITSSGSVDRSDSGWGLRAGYRFSPMWSVEGAYNYLGKFGIRAATTAPVAGSIGGDYEAEAWSLAGLAHFPMRDRFSLYAKAGLARTTVDRKVSSATAGLAAGSASKDRTGLLIGAGAQYDFTNNVFGRAGWDRFTRVGDSGSTGRSDVDVFGLGVGFKF